MPTLHAACLNAFLDGMDGMDVDGPDGLVTGQDEKRLLPRSLGTVPENG